MLITNLFLTHLFEQGTENLGLGTDGIMGANSRWEHAEMASGRATWEEKWFSGAESANGILNVRSGAMNQGSGLEPVA